MTDNYILVNQTPVPEPDLKRWAEWFGNANNRRVALTKLADCDVSTVFLGLDHNFGGIGPPLLFECMVFGGAQDGAQTRCSTWVEAEEMHRRMVRVVTGAEKLT